MHQIEATVDQLEAPHPGATTDSVELPLTERILARLPGPRGLLTVLWSLVALVRLGALLLILNVTNTAPGDAATLDSALRQAIFVYLVLVGLMGAPILVRRIRELDPVLHTIAPARLPSSWFGGVTSTAGPVLLTILAVLVSIPSTVVEFGPVVAVADVFLLSAILLPMMTYIWAYGALLLGFDRLGRTELRLEDFPQDRALGLGALGSVAMTGFWIAVAGSAPVLIIAGSDLTTVATGSAILTVIVGLFVLSMLRLHGQMRAAKARYVAMARSLVAEAYGPVRASTDLATLQANKPALDAAQALVERAEKLLEWPIDERMVAWMTIVVTGVVTSLIVRFVLGAIGA